MAPGGVAAFLKTSGLKYCAVTILIFLLAMHFFALPKMTCTAVQLKNGTMEPVIMPDMRLPDVDATYIHLDYHDFEQTKYHIHSEGCVKSLLLNNTPVPYDKQKSCEYLTGVNINIAPFVQPGDNELKIQLTKPKNDMIHVGPVVFDRTLWHLSDYLGIALIALAFMWLTLFVERRTGEWWSGALISAAMLVAFHQFIHTTYMQYSMDMPDHLKYIAYIAYHLHWPRPDEGYGYFGGRLFYHPPLYYSVQALLLIFANWLGSFSTVSVLRLFDFGCFTAFLVFAALMLGKLIKNRIAYYTALLLLAFYPAGMILAPRIDSNLMFYTLYSGCLYYLLRWLEESRMRHLGIVLILFGLGIATRSNALILAPLIGLALVCQWKKHGRAVIEWRTPILWAGVIVILLGAGMNFGRTAYYNAKGHESDSYIVGNIKTQIGYKTDVTTTPGDFLLFDPVSYWNSPFWDVHEDSTGRQYFWNSLLKSSLFGEFKILEKTQTVWLLDIFLLMLVLYTGASAVMCRRDLKRNREWWLLAITLIVPVLALMLNRILYPFANSQDFRYIYPALASFCGLFGIVIERHLADQHYLRACLGISLAAIFSACSVFVYLG